MNVVDSLAGGDFLKWEQVLNMTNDSVMLKMQMESEKEWYQYRLRKIKS